MGTAADIIISHYKKHARQWVDVPEWKTADGKPLRIHWQLMTVAEAEDFAKSDASMDLDIFVRYAQDKSGQKMFDAEDRLKLRLAGDAHIISRIARLMTGPARTLEDMVDGAEKNSKAITSA
ncbi:hypothetical protein RA307_31700 [Xanthobacteraceae bacterium Astr-EGSB]|uniref:hypothetical protein n=1 Tax=Astrobacterium formosum TaxID=3069710 RepID=UPI0027AED59A|nr:hypothetical protein [Xanthobacteraceae bacterium Astr-EGSB]